MGVRETVLGLCKRLGGATKFATKTTLNVLLPGSGEVVELVGELIECAHETARDQWDFDQKRAEELARRTDQERLERILHLLADDLKGVLGIVSGFVDQPTVARQVVERSVQHDEKIQHVQSLLRDLAARLNRIEKNTEKLLDGQASVLSSQDHLLRKMARLEKQVTRIRKEATPTRGAERGDESQEPSLYEYP